MESATFERTSLDDARSLTKNTAGAGGEEFVMLDGEAVKLAHVQELFREIAVAFRERYNMDVYSMDARTLATTMRKVMKRDDAVRMFPSAVSKFRSSFTTKKVLTVIAMAGIRCTASRIAWTMLCPLIARHLLTTLIANGMPGLRVP